MLTTMGGKTPELSRGAVIVSPSFTLSCTLETALLIMTLPAVSFTMVNACKMGTPLLTRVPSVRVNREMATLLMTFVVPRFKDVFAGMDVKMPGFTLAVLAISDAIRHHILPTMGGLAVVWILFLLFLKTKVGRLIWDKFKLKMPAIGPVISKVAISRFTRTLGTLVSSGVPILQALTIVKETAGNVVISNAVTKVHESVKEGETITAPLESSAVFPPMVVSMVDVGEQTGALPEMLLRIADNYEEEVDNSVAAMTSLLEPIMIVALAVIVGSIVIAMFLPLIAMITNLSGAGGGGGSGD